MNMSIVLYFPVFPCISNITDENMADVVIKQTKQMPTLSCISNITGNNMADAYSEQAPPCEAQIFYLQLWNEEVNYTS